MPKSQPKINKDNLKKAVAANKEKLMELLEIYKVWGEAWAPSEKDGDKTNSGKGKFAVTYNGVTSTYGANGAKSKKNEYLEELDNLVGIAFPDKVKATPEEKLLKKLSLVKVVAALRNFKNADLGKVTINGVETPLAAELAVFKTGVSYLDVIGKVFIRYIQVHNLYENATNNKGKEKISKKFIGADDLLKKQFGKIFAEAPEFDPDNFSFVGTFTGLKGKFIEDKLTGPENEEYAEYRKLVIKLLEKRPNDPDVFTDALDKMTKPSEALKWAAGAHRDHAVFNLLIPAPKAKVPKAKKVPVKVAKGTKGTKGDKGDKGDKAGKKGAKALAKAKDEDDEAASEASEAPKKTKTAKAPTGKAKKAAIAADDSEASISTSTSKKGKSKNAADDSEASVSASTSKGGKSKKEESESESKPKKPATKASKAPKKLVEDEESEEVQEVKAPKGKAIAPKKPAKVEDAEEDEDAEEEDQADADAEEEEDADEDDE